ncbi:MAG: DUF1638 domain-containing protein [Bacillota bacterium]|nr:DUF1638 domain-containing protein [Bacillota bacterium]
MKTAIIACKTLEDEINLAVSKTKTNHKIYWIDSGLHNYPDRLRQNLQECIDKIGVYNYIVLLFGLCGNSLLHLSSKHAKLVIPKVDDCISMFLGGNRERRNIEENTRAYYLTKGWLRYENNIWHEYLQCIEKYGLEKTRKIFGIMLKHYTHLIVIDTGAFDSAEFIEETKKIAVELNLEHKVIKGDLSILDRALTNEWQKDFVVIKPGEKITLNDMGTCGEFISQDQIFGISSA